jgi:beta-glucosidase
MNFPENFVWGAGASSYQIEGAANEDGRGKTVWDVFSHTPGKTKNSDTGDIACDHYHLYKYDVAIMKRIGLKAYRLSMAWSRIFPEGRGLLNRKGLEFYQRLVDELLANDITPFITLFHWDLPQALQENGGFENRDTAFYFRDYAAEAVRSLGDRVINWGTLNEPNIYSSCGHMFGVHAPGKKDLQAALAVGHHELLAHGLALRAIRAERSNMKLGIAISAGMCDPLTDSKDDAVVANRCFDMYNRWYLDGVFKGEYPQNICEEYAVFLPQIEPGDMDIIKTPLDWLGINNYRREVFAYDKNGGFCKERPANPPNCEVTDFNWEVDPVGMYRILKWVSDRYNAPDIYITENGAAYNDEPDDSGRIKDDRRINFMRAYLNEAGRAISDGVKLRGYFTWSILDNFEWGMGYSQRFGIVHVDFKTQKRTIKDSGKWYSGVIASNGRDLSREA